MKKIALTLILVLSTSLCFGMREPAYSNTGLSNPETLIAVLRDANIPLALILIQNGQEEDIKKLLRYVAGRTTFHDLHFYEKIAPALIEKIGESGLVDSLLIAAKHQSFEKIEFLLKKYSNQLSQETLNRTIEATLTTEDIDNFPCTPTRPNPIFRYHNQEATKKNLELIRLLEKYGARLSPGAASKALEAFQDGDYYTGNVPIESGENQSFSGCNQNRRNVIKFFLSQGGVFKTSGRQDCCTAFDAPSIQIDLHRTGKPFTACSALGFAVGCLFGCPCYTLAAARSMIPEEPISLASIMPPNAVRMESQSPLLEPALLTNH